MTRAPYLRYVAATGVDRILVASAALARLPELESGGYFTLTMWVSGGLTFIHVVAMFALPCGVWNKRTDLGERPVELLQDSDLRVAMFGSG